MAVQIKKAETEEDRNIIFQMLMYAYANSPDDDPEWRERRKFFKNSLELIIFEDNKPVSTATSIPMIQNVRGKLYEMAGIASIATNPGARRKGYVTKLMKYMFNEMLGENQVFSTLHPFKESFYGRYGYINFPPRMYATMDAIHFESFKSLNLEGSLERYNIREKITDFLDIQDKFQQITHGFGLFKGDRNFIANHRKEEWIVIAKDKNEEPIGLITYRITGIFGEMKINNFFYLSSNAKFLLLKWIALHIDQVNKVELNVPINEDIITWAYDLYPSITPHPWIPTKMGRIVNISLLNGMNVGKSEIKIKVSDPYCEWNNGCWLFKSNDGKLIVEKTNDCDYLADINGLSAIIYGNYLIDDLISLGWLKTSGKSLEPIKIMFPRLNPYLYESF